MNTNETQAVKDLKTSLRAINNLSSKTTTYEQKMAIAAAAIAPSI